MLRCIWFSHDPASPAEADWFALNTAEARDADGQPVAGDICLTRFEVNPSTDTPVLDLCGDADESGDVAAPDALLALRQSLGLPACSGRCDVDRSGETSVADALAILKAAVGLAQPLLCSSHCIG